MEKFKILTADLIKEMFEKQKGIAYKLNGEATDYLKLLGGSTYGSDVGNDVYGDYWIDGYNSYTSSLSHLYNVYNHSTSSSIGTRPVISFTAIKDKAKKIDDFPVERYQFGEYPQTVIDKRMQQKLENLYVSNGIQTTNKFYTISPYMDDGIVSFYSLNEYEVDGKKYVRVPYLEQKRMRGIKPEMIKYLPSYWVEVEPITWLVDQELDIALSEKVLFSGVAFSDRKLYESDYEKRVTPILEQYLNRIFCYEINEISLFSSEDIELEKLINFTIDKVYDFLGGRKTQNGLIEAVDEIVIALVKMTNKKNLTREKTSEEVVCGILDRTSKETRGKEVGFSAFENAIAANEFVKKNAKDEAIERIESKRPKNIGSIHHDDWWEDDDTYYPTCNHLIRRPAEKNYWKRMK